MSNNELTAATLGIDSVFVGGPFFKVIDPSTGRMPQPEVELIEGLIRHFEDMGARVFNAHKRERWGEKAMEPHVYTKLDYDGVAEADIMVSMPGCRPPSLGTHIELGWASALRKPMVLLIEPEGEYSGMIQGMHTLAPTEVIHIIDKQVDYALLDRSVIEVLRRARLIEPTQPRA